MSVTQQQVNGFYFTCQSCESTNVAIAIVNKEKIVFICNDCANNSVFEIR